MVKHWYRVDKKHPFLCDILGIQYENQMDCELPSKDCNSCKVYKSWKRNQKR